MEQINTGSSSPELPRLKSRDKENATTPLAAGSFSPTFPSTSVIQNLITLNKLSN